MNIILQKLVASLGATLLISTASAMAPSLETLGTPVTVEQSKPATPPEKNQELQLIIEQLIQCESGGKNVTILDTNNQLSAGILQFQLLTFKHYALRYDLAPHAEENELENLWKDSWLQREVAYRMIEEDRGNLRHWTNCSRKLGFL